MSEQNTLTRGYFLQLLKRRGKNKPIPVFVKIGDKEFPIRSFYFDEEEEKFFIKLDDEPGGVITLDSDYEDLSASVLDEES